MFETAFYNKIIKQSLLELDQDTRIQWISTLIDVWVT